MTKVIKFDSAKSILCKYRNSTLKWQRIETSNGRDLPKVERSVAPGQAVLFEAQPESNLKVFILTPGVNGFPDEVIPCSKLEVLNIPLDFSAA